jgi:hypothetical protein
MLEVSHMLLLDIDDTLLRNTRAEALAALEFGHANCSRIPGFDSSSFVGRWKPEVKPILSLMGIRRITAKNQDWWMCEGAEYMARQEFA